MLGRRFLRCALRSQFARHSCLLLTLAQQCLLIALGLLLCLLLRLLIRLLLCLLFLRLLQLGEPAYLGSVALRLLFLRLLPLQRKLLLQRLFTRRIGHAPGQRFLRQLRRFGLHDGFRFRRRRPRHNLFGRIGRVRNQRRRTGIDLG